MAKTVVVFGADGALGRVLVEELKASPYRVVTVGRDVEAGDAAAMAAQVDRCGDDLYGVLHLVGRYRGGMPVEDVPLETFDDLWRSNVMSTVHAFRAALPHLKRQDEGRLLAVGAYAPLRHGKNGSVYNITKAAMHELVLTLAEELQGSRITVNAVLPSVIDNAVNRARRGEGEIDRWVSPQRLSRLLMFLLGDDGADVHGALIPVRARV